MGIAASSELGRAILRQHPKLLASSTKAERAAKREALTWRGITLRSKAELAYAQRLEALRRGVEGSPIGGEVTTWRYEPVTLHLPGGVRFTPDFQVFGSESLTSGYLRTYQAFHEVKPAARLPRERDSIVRLKVAAASFPEFRFYLARLSRGGEWEISEVRP